MKICPFCFEEIKDENAARCGNCGAELNPPQNPALGIEEDPAAVTEEPAKLKESTDADNAVQWNKNTPSSQQADPVQSFKNDITTLFKHSGDFSVLDNKIFTEINRVGRNKYNFSRAEIIAVLKGLSDDIRLNLVTLDTNILLIKKGKADYVYEVGKRAIIEFIAVNLMDVSLGDLSVTFIWDEKKLGNKQKIKNIPSKNASDKFKCAIVPNVSGDAILKMVLEYTDSKGDLIISEGEISVNVREKSISDKSEVHIEKIEIHDIGAAEDINIGSQIERAFKQKSDSQIEKEVEECILLRLNENQIANGKRIKTLIEELNEDLKKENLTDALNEAKNILELDPENGFARSIKKDIETKIENGKQEQEEHLISDYKHLKQEKMFIQAQERLHEIIRLNPQNQFAKQELNQLGIQDIIDKPLYADAALLNIVYGLMEKKIYLFSKNTIYLGRSSGDFSSTVDIGLRLEPLDNEHPENFEATRKISKYHAQISFTEDNILLKDLSKNGTFVNGKQIKENPNSAYIIKDGDEINIATVLKLKVRILKSGFKSSYNQMTRTWHTIDGKLSNSGIGIDIVGGIDAVKLSRINNYADKEEYVILIRKVAIIGNSPDNGIYINDKSISKLHANILYKDGTYWIEDNNSSAGTYVNGEKIRKRVQLRNGDRIKFGNVTTVFKAIPKGKEGA